MNPFLWIVWVILAIPVIIIGAAVIAAVMLAIKDSVAKEQDARKLRVQIATAEARNLRRDAAVRALRDQIAAERQRATPPKYGVRTEDPASFLDKKDGGIF